MFSSHLTSQTTINLFQRNVFIRDKSYKDSDYVLNFTALNRNVDSLEQREPSEIQSQVNSQGDITVKQFLSIMVISLKCYGYLMLTFLAGKEENWTQNTANPG